MFLCLYNSYDKLRVHDAHVRSVARAAPVCYAVGFHLVLLDFPEPMYGLVKESTTVGESGRFLEALKVKSRFSELSKKLPLGTLVVTTSKPDENKKVDCQTLAELSARGENLAFIVGLGRRGLPRKLREKARYHWDATERGISLETCTAIGFIAARFATWQELRKT